MERIGHWVGGKQMSGESGRTGPVFNPATGEQTHEVDFAIGGGGRPGDRRRPRGLPGLARDLAVEARRDHVPDPRPGRRAPARDRPAHHAAARQGPVGRDGRGRARPREHRVRLRHPEPAEGRLHRAGLDRRRRLLDPPAARRRRRHHAVQLPGDGAHVDVRERDRVRERVHPEALGEGPRRQHVHRRAAVGGGRCPTACSTSCRATRWSSTGCSSTPTSAR